MALRTPIVMLPDGSTERMGATDTIEPSNLATGTPTVNTFINGLGAWASVTPALTVRSVSTSGAVVVGDGVIIASETITLTLPTAADAANKRYDVKNIGTGMITIVPANIGETIDGDTSLIIQYQYSAVGLISNGATWSLV